MISTAAVLKKWHCLGNPLPSHHLLFSHGYRVMAGRLCWYPKGQFSAQVGKHSQGSLRVLQNCSHTFLGGGGEEQAPTTGYESHCWSAPGEEPEATWKGCAAHQPLGSVCPISAGLCTGEVASAEPASPYTVIAMDRQFKAVRREDKLNVVQLPVKPHAGRNDL